MQQVGLTFQAQASDTTTQTTYTFSSQPIGVADSNRLVCVGIVAKKAGAGLTLSSMTIGGVTATIATQLLSEEPDSQVLAVAYATVPTGTTASIVATFNTSVIRASICTYTIIGSTGTVEAYVSAKSNTANIATYNGGAVIGFSAISGNTACTWRNLVDNSNDSFSSFTRMACGSLYQYGDQASSNILNSLTLGITNLQLVAVSFKPLKKPMNVRIGSSFVDKPIKVCTPVKNYNSYPTFTGTGSIANGWGAYTSGATGSRSVASNQQTIVLNTGDSGNRAIGIARSVGGTALGFAGQANQWFVSGRVKTDLTGIAAGTYGLCLIEFYNSGTYVGQTPTVLTSDTSTSEMLVPPYLVPGAFTSITIYFWVASSAAGWSGTSTAKVKEYALYVSRNNEVYPYFDGSSSGCSWDGATGASVSSMATWKDGLINYYNGSAWAIK